MNLAFNNHHPPIGKCVKIQKFAQRMIFKFFALELYISWEAETQEKLQVLLKQTLRLDRLAVRGNEKNCSQSLVQPHFGILQALR